MAVVSELVKEVRVAMDINRADTVLSGIGDEDTLKLDELIRSKLEDAARIVLMNAPNRLLDGVEIMLEDIPGYNVSAPRAAARPDEDGNTTGGSVGETNLTDAIISHTYCGKLRLPADFLRLVSFKMDSWFVPVTATIDEEQVDYSKLRCGYAGIGGNQYKPVLTVAHGDEGLVMEIWPYTLDDLVERALYVKRPEIKEEEDESGTQVEVIAIGDRLRSAVVYQTAQMVAATLGEIDLAGVLGGYVSEVMK